MIKKVLPCNRRILIESYVKEQKEDEHLLVPEEFLQKKKQGKYSKWRVCCWSQDITTDTSIKVNVGDYVIVEGNMVEEIDVDGEIYYTIQENYVILVIKR